MTNEAVPYRTSPDPAALTLPAEPYLSAPNLTHHNHACHDAPREVTPRPTARSLTRQPHRTLPTSSRATTPARRNRATASHALPSQLHPTKRRHAARHLAGHAMPGTCVAQPSDTRLDLPRRAAPGAAMRVPCVAQICRDPPCPPCANPPCYSPTYGAQPCLPCTRETPRSHDPTSPIRPCRPNGAAPSRAHVTPPATLTPRPERPCDTVGTKPIHAGPTSRCESSTGPA